MKYILIILTATLATLSCIDAGRKAEYYNDMAYEQLISGDYTGSLENYNKALALDSTIADFYFYHNRGLAKKKLGDSIATLDDWVKAIYLDAEPMDMAQLRESLIILYSNMGVTADTEGRYSEALENYNQAIAIDPTDAVNYINRGATYEHLSDYKNAEQDFLKAIALDSTETTAYYNMGCLMEIMEENDKAIHYFLKFIKLNPTNEDGYFLLAKALYKQKRYAESIECMKVYVRYQRNNPEAYYYLGMCYKELGKKAEARRNLELARDMGLEDAKKELDTY